MNSADQLVYSFLGLPHRLRELVITKMGLSVTPDLIGVEKYVEVFRQLEGRLEEFQSLVLKHGPQGEGIPACGVKAQPEVFKCMLCREPILGDAVVVEGNVYVIQYGSQERGGVVGNNFPTADGLEMLRVEEIRESVFCCACFVDVFGGVLDSNE